MLRVYIVVVLHALDMIDQSGANVASIHRANRSGSEHTPTSTYTPVLLPPGFLDCEVINNGEGEDEGEG